MQRYIGNKTKILNNIYSIILENNIKGKNFVDLFAGSGSVTKFFKSKNYIVTSNDVLNFSFVIQKAILSFEKKPEFRKFIKSYKIDPIKYLNNLKEIDCQKSNFFINNFSEKARRLYFSNGNAAKIDLIRSEIENLLRKKIILKSEYYYLLYCLMAQVNSIANTCGTFGAFIKKPTKSFYNPILLKHINIGNGKLGKVYKEDALKLVKKLEGDILYVDPPYTVIDYSQAYHVLETLILDDSPNLKGITGRRPQDVKTSLFTRKHFVKKAFEKLLKNSKNFRNIILSYSTHALLDYKILINIVKKHYSNVKIYFFKHQKYTTALKNQKGKLLEILILGMERND